MVFWVDWPSRSCSSHKTLTPPRLNIRRPKKLPWLSPLWGLMEKSSQMRRTLLRPREQLRLGRSDDVSRSDFLNGRKETDRRESGSASREKSRAWHKTTPQKVHPASLPRSRLTQSRSAPGLGSRPPGRARRLEAWAPPGAVPRGTSLAGDGRPRVPAPPSPRPRARPALRPPPLVLRVRPRRARHPRARSGAARGAPSRVYAAHGRGCTRGTPGCSPLRIRAPRRGQIPAHAFPCLSPAAAPFGGTPSSQGWPGTPPCLPSPCPLTAARLPRNPTPEKHAVPPSCGQSQIS